MTDQMRDFVFNLVRIVLEDYFKTSIVPLKYANDHALYTGDVSESFSRVDLVQKVEKVLTNIDSVMYYYDLKDPQSLFFFKVPKIENKIFYYNPFRGILDPFNKEEIVSVIRKLRLSRKSKSIKVVLEKDLVAQR